MLGHSGKGKTNTVLHSYTDTIISLPRLLNSIKLIKGRQNATSSMIKRRLTSKLSAGNNHITANDLVIELIEPKCFRRQYIMYIAS